MTKKNIKFYQVFFLYSYVKVNLILRILLTLTIPEATENVRDIHFKEIYIGCKKDCFLRESLELLISLRDNNAHCRFQCREGKAL